MSEYDEQCAVVQYCDLKRIPYFHIPNEGRRSPATGARLKALGLKPGVPDLCLPFPNKSHHALYIEMKAKHGTVSEAQRGWIKELRSLGNAAYVCFGADNAIALIDAYVAGGI